MIFSSRLAAFHSLCYGLIFLFLGAPTHAQSLLISPTDLYNSDYRDSVQVLERFDDLSLSDNEQQLIATDHILYPFRKEG